MPFGKSKTLLLIVAILLTLAACAPDNLDITPSPTPTNTPEPTATRPPTATPNPDPTIAASDAEAAAAITEVVAADPFVALQAAFPNPFNAGVQWRHTKDQGSGNDVNFTDVDGGRTMTVYFSEQGGSLAEITIGLFDTPEAAETYYNDVAGRTRTLENATENAALPTPNRFGQGTYGLDSLLLRGTQVVRIAVPRYSTSAGQPLVPLMRNTLRLMDPIVGTGS